MIRHSVRIYVTLTLLNNIKEKAYLAGLLPSQFVKYIVLKEIDGMEAKRLRQRIINKVVDD